jgi:solute carrier family 25 carnitine/acylcarnitine transporter 20/29
MLVDFMAGWAGGVSVLVLLHPFDTVKVRQQATGPQMYRNSADCVAQIYRTDGMAGFYKGMGAPLMGVGISSSILFGVYGFLSHRFAQWNDSKEVGLSGHLQNCAELQLWQNVMCATASGAASSSAMTPFEVVKIRLQTETYFVHRRYYGALDCARKLYEQGGLVKLYMGWCATMIRDVPAAVTYFGIYGNLRAVMPQDSAPTTIASVLFAGGGGGCSAVGTRVPT